MMNPRAAWLTLTLLTTPALAQPPFDMSDAIEDALATCHDGVYEILEPSVDPPSISFQAGPRDVRVFFGNVKIDYVEQGSAGRQYHPQARLTFTCAGSVACVWSGPWNAQMAVARAEHGVSLLSSLPQREASFVLHCADIRAAQALHQALLAFQRAIAH